MIDMLFGQVNDGMDPVETVAKPSSMKRWMFGMAPSAMKRCRYSGSPPSMHTTTTGRSGQR
ncbi:hypothetical protein D3C80_1841660 [compost metagenome]